MGRFPFRETLVGSGAVRQRTSGLKVIGCCGICYFKLKDSSHLHKCYYEVTGSCMENPACPQNNPAASSLHPQLSLLIFSPFTFVKGRNEMRRG